MKILSTSYTTTTTLLDTPPQTWLCGCCSILNTRPSRNQSLPFDVTLHAFSVQVRGLQGAEEGVAHAEALRDDFIDVGYVHDAGVYKTPDLVQDSVSKKIVGIQNLY